MEKINIDRKIAKRADGFAEREYVCGAEERAHLSKGYYWGYKDAQKDLALTWEDIATLIRLCEQVKTEWWFKAMKCIGTQKHFEEVLRRFNEQRKK